jgi:hypothetical protein
LKTSSTLLSVSVDVVKPDTSSTECVQFLPRKPMSPLVEFDQVSILVNHNAGIAAGRYLVVELACTLIDRSSIGLGTLHVHVAEQQARCPRDGSWWNVSKPISTSNSLQVGTMQLRARS